MFEICEITSTFVAFFRRSPLTGGAEGEEPIYRIGVLYASRIPIISFKTLIAMKKSAIVPAILMALFLSCQENPVIPEDESRIFLTVQRGDKKVETSSVDFSGEGGTMEVGLTCKGDWSVNAAPSSWLSVTPEYGTDAATLMVKALVNTDKDSRLGAVIVTCGDKNVTLTVTQSGTWLTLSADTLQFTSSGGADTLTLSSNVAWRVSSMADWLSVTPASSKGDGRVIITAADNPSASSRKGVVTVTSDGYSLPVTILQEARYLHVATEPIHFGNEGGRHVVTVDDDGTFDVRTDVDWLTFEKEEDSFVVIAADNATPSVRQATITVFLADLSEGTLEQSIIVTQESRFLNVETRSLQFANAGGRSEAVSVSTNGTFDVRTDVDWLTFEKGEDSFVVIAADNASLSTRQATVTVFLADLVEGTLERTISVRQEARFLSLGTSSLEFESQGGRSEAVTVSTNGTFDVRTDLEWLTFEKGEDSFVVIAADNATLSVRQATVTVFLADLNEGLLERTIFVLQLGSVFGEENGYEWVNFDLPSGTLWATCNVGANSPEKYGFYFAWGETEPKSKYDWSTYKWCNGSETTLTKYITYSSYGTVDNKTVLDLADDAARMNWGGNWRMPTREEFQELSENCTWTWTTQNGVNGYKVTSQSNGSSIFLPAAGYRGGTRLNDAGTIGHFWSSSLDAGELSSAWLECFVSGSYGVPVGYRYYGRSVRPVCRP